MSEVHVAPPGHDAEVAELPVVDLEPHGATGSTAVLFRVQPGVVLKSPVAILPDRTIRPRPEVASKYDVERKILDRLGDHPRIVRCLGWQDQFPTGILFLEATHGSLQQYLKLMNPIVMPSTRHRWFRQAIEAVAYIHSRGVIHCDLRPDNFLVHSTGGVSLDIYLCDFGGSSCEELGVDGGSYPDSGFCDPNAKWEAIPATDLFSLGSVLYTILTGYWPHGGPCGSFGSSENRKRYEQHVDGLFKQGIYPDTKKLYGGDIIMGCWTRNYSTVNQIVRDIPAGSG